MESARLKVENMWMSQGGGSVQDGSVIGKPPVAGACPAEVNKGFGREFRKILLKMKNGVSLSTEGIEEIRDLKDQMDRIQYQRELVSN